MPRKNVPIDYLARDYASIKEALVQHAKRYYPDTYKDFNEAGFGSLVTDMIAYIGDQTSFNVDYAANESFMDSANEFDNILRHAKPFGYRLRLNPSSHGIATFFVLVPANSTGLGPDSRYIPRLKKGTRLSSKSGNAFTLNEDVFFDKSDNEVVVGRVDDTTGLPTYYAIKSYGQVVSGRQEETFITVSDFQKFLKVPIGIGNVTEILLVEDDEGHEYYEVEYLSQDIVYRPILNRISGDNEPQSILKPFVVPRRFVVEREGTDVYLQFGHGSDATEKTSERMVDPSRTILQVHGREYISDESFDPTNLIKTDKFGIVPENTVLRVVARVNTADNVNAAADSITEVSSPEFDFDDISTLDTNTVNFVKNSLEVTNEEPIIGDVSLPNSSELKKRIYNSFASQNRAVTEQDYQALVYRMPAEYGAIKRVSVVRDINSFKRNLNLYTISENQDGVLVSPNSTIKNNLKVWLNKNRMINDTIDILDAKIINLGINYTVVGDLEKDKFDILADANYALKQNFLMKKDIGEHFFITDVYDVLKKVPGIVDVTGVKIFQKNGGLYSDIRFNLGEAMSADGRYIKAPKNCIFEIKYPDSDIKGTVK